MPQPTHIYASALSRRDRRWRGARTPHPQTRRRHPPMWRLFGVATVTALMLEALRVLGG